MLKVSSKIETQRRSTGGLNMTFFLTILLIKLNKLGQVLMLKANRFGLVTVLGLIVLGVSTIGGYAQRTGVFPDDDTIVIDPGHGGHDQGARGPKGSLEKTVTMNLARRIQTVIGHNYKVLLTRSDDYGLELDERTAMANHAGAKLFISLHTGGSLGYESSGLTVYYFEEIYRPIKKPEQSEAESIEEENLLVAWDTAQQQHNAKSRRFAGILQQKLKMRSDKPSCELRGAPLVVLRGADMPAVLIEVGYLTHPVDEKKLDDPQILNEIAEIIGRSVDEFLAKTP